MRNKIKETEYSQKKVIFPKYFLVLLTLSIILSIFAIVISFISILEKTEIGNEKNIDIVECSDEIPCYGDFVCDNGSCVGTAECMTDDECEVGECFKGRCLDN